MDKVPAQSLPTRASGAGWQLARSFCPATILRNLDALLPPRRQPPGLHDLRRGSAHVRAGPRAAALAEDAPAAGARPGRARQPRGDARPARSRALGPPAGHDALLDALLRAADDRAARPPRGRRGGAGRDLAGRQRDARGRGARARARARHGRRDARARQRAAGLRDRLHAADGRPDLRRARHAPRRARGADGPQRRRPAAGRRRPGHHPPGPRRPARPSCTGCSSGARRRTRRCAARSPRRPWSSATHAIRSTPSATPTRWSPSCRTPGSCRPARSSSCASAPSG